MWLILANALSKISIESQTAVQMTQIVFDRITVLGIVAIVCLCIAGIIIFKDKFKYHNERKSKKHV